MRGLGPEHDSWKSYKKLAHTEQLIYPQRSLIQLCPDWQRCDTAVRTEYVLPVTSPVSLLTQTSFTIHSVQYIQYTLSVHLSLL
jgi:hypothetical protein